MKKAFVSSIAILLSASMLGGTVHAANAVPVATSTTEETDYRYDEVYTGTCGNDTVSATYTFAFGEVREDGSLPLELTFSTEDVDPSEFTYYTGTYNTFWEDSDLISWEYDKSTRTLTFSGTGSMVDKENNYASRVWKHILSEDCIIQNVIFEEGITDLGYIDTTLFELSCWSNYDKVPMTNRTVSIPESVPEANLTDLQPGLSQSSVPHDGYSSHYICFIIPWEMRGINCKKTCAGAYPAQGSMFCFIRRCGGRRCNGLRTSFPRGSRS